MTTSAQASPPWERYGPESDLSMAYLLTTEARRRHALAAEHVRACAHVIEIGGYKVPITQHLVGEHASVTVVDPEVDAFETDSWNNRPCRIRHLPQRFQDVALSPPPGDYGLVLLGLALRHFTPGCELSEWARLTQLSRNARVVIIEYCLGWPHAEADYAFLTVEAELTLRLQLDLTLPPSASMDPCWATRRFCVLDPPRGARAGQGD
ncbi:MAG TPA: hypothetical protein PKA88_10050 [Polyangiaceae bacterium]|nr:hypothetical protein [Polyangiaceae bacterium]